MAVQQEDRLASYGLEPGGAGDAAAAAGASYRSRAGLAKLSRGRAGEDRTFS